MRNLSCIISFIWVTIIACNGNTTNNAINSVGSKDDNSSKIRVDYKKIKNKKQFVYNINNADTDSFGFMPVADDQALGIKSLLIYNNCAYLTDPFHGNVKKIDLVSGIVKSSSILLNDKYFKICSITSFNNSLYVFSEKEDVFILDYDLTVKDQFKLDSKYKGDKDVYYIKQDTLVIFRPNNDVVQLDNGQMQVSLIKIDKKHSISREVLLYPDYETYKDLFPNIRGSKYLETKEQEKNYLITSYGKFELPEGLPNTSQYYDSKNMDFTFDKIVYFNITPEKVQITVCEY